MRQWVPVDFYEEDQDFVHVNPNVVANIGVQNNYGNDASNFPFLVVAYMINHEVVEYKFKTLGEAKSFIRKIGSLN